jgi:hypothetical protein
MAKDLRRPVLIAAAALALVEACSPARAQFMAPGGFPVIAVPPPPAQSYVMPKKPKPAPVSTPVSQPSADPSAPPQLSCTYHGQTRVCE